MKKNSSKNIGDIGLKLDMLGKWVKVCECVAGMIIILLVFKCPDNKYKEIVKALL